MSFRYFMTTTVALGLATGSALAQQPAPAAGQPAPVRPAAPAAQPAPVRPAAPAAAAAQPAPAQPAPGQPAAAQPPANQTPPIAGPQPDWVKTCDDVPISQQDPKKTKQVCQTVRDLRGETGQTLAQVSIREDKEAKKRILVVAIPPGMQIQPGVRVIVDQQVQQVLSAKFTVCLPQVCLAEVELKDDALASFKKGTTLNLQALTIQAKGVTFPIQLAGFAKVYDGEPMDMEKVKAQQEELRKQMEQKAQEELNKLNGGGAPQPAPAPPAPIQ